MIVSLPSSISIGGSGRTMDSRHSKDMHDCDGRDDEDGGEQPFEDTSDGDDDSYLGARMAFPSSLVNNSSLSKKMTIKNSRRRPRRASNPISNSQVESTFPWGPSSYRTENMKNSSRASSDRKFDKLSKEEKHLRQLYMEAHRHQVTTARVTKVEDFGMMSVKLPAAKSTKKKSFDGLHFPRLTCSSPHAKKLEASSMFRGGGKSSKSSPAAGSFLAQAKQVDRHCSKDSKRPRQMYEKEPHFLHSTMMGDSMSDSLNSDDNESFPNQRHGWKSWLSTRRLTNRSSIIEI